MILTQRIDHLVRLGEYIQSNDIAWQAAKEKACQENGWFIPEFVNLATQNIAHNYLERAALERWVQPYNLAPDVNQARTVGIVMAGNIPMVGFHDLISVFVAGHRAQIKLSARDEALTKHLVGVLLGWDPEIGELVAFSDVLRKCDAYIATGSNNTSRYFEYYFGRYAHIIRRNKTSVAVLTGTETEKDIDRLADDVYQFFGLGCRNVTKVYVPREYGFQPMLRAFEKYNYLADHHKYKNNYDYNLALHILNNKLYMTNGSLLVVEDPAMFSPISQLNFEYYTDQSLLISSLEGNEDIQCIVGLDKVPFGKAQSPGLFDYADRVDTMAFLQTL